MNRLICLAAAVVLCGTPLAQSKSPARPPITGISHISVYTSHPDQAQHFYQHDLGFKKMPDPENPAGVRYYVDSDQFVEVLPLPSGQGVNRLDHIGWITPNARAMRLYLKAHGVIVPEQIQHGNDGS